MPAPPGATEAVRFAALTITAQDVGGQPGSRIVFGGHVIDVAGVAPAALGPADFLFV